MSSVTVGFHFKKCGPSPRLALSIASVIFFPRIHSCQLVHKASRNPNFHISVWLAVLRSSHRVTVIFNDKTTGNFHNIAMLKASCKEPWQLHHHQSRSMLLRLFQNIYLQKLILLLQRFCPPTFRDHHKAVLFGENMHGTTHS
jgi:hypothetical protein